MAIQSAVSKDFMNPDLSLEERVNNLLAQVTSEEKISQMLYSAPAIPRLGIPEYNWGNECLHGVARAGAATIFPQAIGMAASFNTHLMFQVADVISDEARAKHHEAIRNGKRRRYFGLTYWSPNINIFRDPRWGRGQETYGEDPYLTARMGVNFVKGLQGNNSHYLKLVATPKHFAVHSGPEADRHHFNATPESRDMAETYLPAFKACVQEGKAASVMGAYNRTYGEPCCASHKLLQEILRDEWGFNGYVVSDCGAIYDIHNSHMVTKTPAESAALAVKNGCDLNCGEIYKNLIVALKTELITEKDIDRSVRRLLRARFKLGMFDPPERVKYAQIPPERVDCQKHRSLAREMAQESIVLLKNENDLLPLDLNKISTIAVVGPNATSFRPLLGNYYGYSSRIVTPLEGILGAVSCDTDVTYAKGCDLMGASPIHANEMQLATQQADVIIAVMGLSPELEGEEGEVAAADSGGDRSSISLPGRQEEFLKTLYDTGKPVVLVLTCGSPVEILWAKEHLPAILVAWYPGEEGGNAIADVLFGKYNPAGRLPVTFVKSLAQLPAFQDYNMQGRTYRFMNEQPLYYFGYGLSYTMFKYSNLRLNHSKIKAGEQVTVTVDLKNTGTVTGGEVAQLYVTDVRASVPVPHLHLEGFERITLKPAEKKTISFTLAPENLAAYDNNGKPFIEPGKFSISVGGGQPCDPECKTLTASLIIT